MDRTPTVDRLVLALSLFAAFAGAAPGVPQNPDRSGSQPAAQRQTQGEASMATATVSVRYIVDDVAKVDDVAGALR